jgi:hypothetical protein
MNSILTSFTLFIINDKYLFEKIMAFIRDCDFLRAINY